jgi:hypothetical protein
MDFWYTARGTYDKHYDQEGISWNKYLDWSKLSHLREVISLDTMLNEILVKPDHNYTDDWNHIITQNLYETGCFTDLDYVIKKIQPMSRFNLLAVIQEPAKECNSITVKDFEFVGYDLLDQSYDTSALTNCGGFDETFSASDLNQLGLISDYGKAYVIKKRLVENNPDEYHADCNVMAIWRHKTIGRRP